MTDAGKDEDGREDDFLEVDEAQGGNEVTNTATNVANGMNHHTDGTICLNVKSARGTCVSGQVGS